MTFLRVVVCNLLLMASTLGHADTSMERVLAQFSVYQDGPAMDAVGYSEGMADNGELVVMLTIPKDGIVFDVGANVGDWTASAIVRQPTCKVYAFEPLPMLFADIQHRFRDEAVIANPLALTDFCGEVTMVYYPQNAELSTLHRRPGVEECLGLTPVYISVQADTLDSFCAEHSIPHIDLLKIDTEGNEWYVLSGADSMIKSGAIDLIQFEYGGCYLDSNTTLQAVLAYLRANGYAIYRLSSIGLIEIQEWRPELENYTYSNYLALRRS